jgi:hypothetical protein
MNVIEGLLFTLFGIALLVLGATEWSSAERYDTTGEPQILVSYNRLMTSLDSALESWEEENPGLYPVECRRVFRSTFNADWSCRIHDSTI